MFVLMFPPVKIAIENAAGVPVANLEVPGAPGLGRVSWDLRLTKDLATEYGGEGAKQMVRSGEYKVTLTRGATKSELRVEIAPGIRTR